MTSNMATARLTTEGGIRYKLLEGYPQLQISDDGITATEKILIQAVDFLAFWKESFPRPIEYTHWVQVSERRAMPNSQGALRTKSLTVESFPGTMPWLPFEETAGDLTASEEKLCAITITYEPAYNGTPYTKSVQMGGEFLVFSPKKTKVYEETANRSPGDTHNSMADAATPNKDFQQTSAKTVPFAEHSIRKPIVINPNWDAIIGSLGCVNANTLTTHQTIKKYFPWYIQAQGQFLSAQSERETIMFTGVSAEQKWMTYIAVTGGLRYPYVQEAWDIEYRFSEKRISEYDATTGNVNIYGWNHSWNAEKNAWVYIYRKNGMPLHRPVNFDYLWLKQGSRWDAGDDLDNPAVFPVPFQYI